MTDNRKTPETINQMISFVSGVKSQLRINKSKMELKKVESILHSMKNSPELYNSCSLDFKIDNPEFYLNIVENIRRKDELGHE